MQCRRAAPRRHCILCSRQTEKACRKSKQAYYNLKGSSQKQRLWELKGYTRETGTVFRRTKLGVKNARDKDSKVARLKVPLITMLRGRARSLGAVHKVCHLFRPFLDPPPLCHIFRTFLHFHIRFYNVYGHRCHISPTQPSPRA